MPKRRTHQPEFKAQVALDALRSKKTLAEIAASYELHPVQVCQWRQQALKRLPDLFRQVDLEDADRSADRLSQQLARLEQANADLMTEVQWLKKKFCNYDQLILRSLLEPDHPCISLRRQCKLIGVVRSSYYYRSTTIQRHPPRLVHLIDQFCTLDPRMSNRCLLSRLNAHGFTLCKTTLHRLLCRLGFAPFERKLIKLLEARLLQMPPSLCAGMALSGMVSSGFWISRIGPPRKGISLPVCWWMPARAAVWHGACPIVFRRLW